ncbi:MAG: MSCRAMM family adhesin SdrC, partial [Alphaproteobacteria bacterium]|nr:MSCRAMM family adhesin SdrC [Alphaproteobacteria bacterium]
MKNSILFLFLTAGFSASILFFESPLHCTNAKDYAEEKSSPRLASLSLNSSSASNKDVFDDAPLSDTLLTSSVSANSNKSLIPPLARAQALRLDLSSAGNAEHTEKGEELHTRKLSSRLIMPSGSTKVMPTAQEDENDSFEDMAEDIEAALNRLAILNKEPKKSCGALLSKEGEKKSDLFSNLLVNSTLDTSSDPDYDTSSDLDWDTDTSSDLDWDVSSITPLTTKPLEKPEIAIINLHRELSQLQGTKLVKMIEIAKGDTNPTDLRIFYGRQAVMFLMTDNSFSRTFEGDKDLEIFNLILLLSSLNDPYAILRLAECQLKSDSPKGSSTQDQSTNVEKANSTFMHALNLLLERYDPEEDHVYLFNSMRTIVTEAAIFNVSLE